MRADRLLSILLLLQTRGRMTAKNLADTLEVSERTIYRDLDALSMAGVPVYAERGPGGGCTLTEGYRTDLTGLTEDEVHSLFMPGVPSPLADLGLGHVREEALLKLMAALPSVRRLEAERVRQRILLDATGWFQLEESVPYLPVVQEAVWQNRRLHLSYRRGDNKCIERLIDPYGIVAKTSIWYVVGAAQGNFRTYRVSRILAATLTDEYFERPESFDLAVFWSETCTQFETSRSHFVATLRFAPDVIPFLPYMFGEEVLALIEQAVPPDDDGWITLSLNFEHLDAACNHVLGLGTQVEVLAPQELREQVADCAARIAAFYHNPRQDSPGGKPITAVPEAKQGAD